LRRVFEDGLAISAKDWLREERMVAARSLLREGSAVKEVAADLGFSSPKVFSREFQETYHLTPTDLQRKDLSFRMIPVAGSSALSPSGFDPDGGVDHGFGHVEVCLRARMNPAKR